MPKIQVLPEQLCLMIAAGEIVERPASVVKELVENAIDAGGTRILIEVEEAGRRLIRVSDNGEGIGPEDAETAFLRHATSKLRAESDLLSIRTMGFRGEALPSIGAVARVRLVTGLSGSPVGTEVRMNGGRLVTGREAPSPGGTLVEVEELFYNTPARKKFLRSNSTELVQIVRAVELAALSHPWIQFRLSHNGRLFFDRPAVRDELERVLQVYGHGDPSDLIEVGGAVDWIRLKGLISRPGERAARRNPMEFFLNRRPIRNPTLAHAVLEAYGTLLGKGRQPRVFLFIEIDPSRVDVNVHPAKREIRFRDSQSVHQFVRHTLRERLQKEGFVVPGSFEESVPGPRSLSGFPIGSYREGPARDAQPRKGGDGSADQTREALEHYRPIESGLRADAPDDRIPSGSFDWPRTIETLGQVDDTYIVAVVDSELHLIDQHAAHERLLYERLRTQHREARLAVQPLLLPEVVDLAVGEAVGLREIGPLLARIGIETEPFGERSVRILALPGLLGAMDGARLLHELLEGYREEARIGEEAILSGMMASMACQAAIKAHQALGAEQMKRLLEDLYREAVPPTCPHGRPIRFRFTRPELERLFLRR